MSTIYTPQMMLLLAQAVDADDSTPYKGCDTVTQTIVPAIDARLAQINASCGTSWSVIWGPATFSFPINFEGRHFDNVVFIARDGTTNNYVIAVAGTDFKSLADWIFEDFIVGTTVPWFLEISYEPRPKISLATFNGLTILLNIAPCSGLPGYGYKIKEFLRTLTKNGPINLYTTGHSLGGALAPSLTLALDDLRWLWDLEGNATFYPFAFAGPTPGDAAFAGYFAEKFPQGLQRVWNSYDIVPHAWDTPHLQELPTLYGSKVESIQVAVDLIIDKVGSIGYTPLNDQGPAFSGALQPPPVTDFDTYFKQAIYQHTTAYSAWANHNLCPPPTS